MKQFRYGWQSPWLLLFAFLGFHCQQIPPGNQTQTPPPQAEASSNPPFFSEQATQAGLNFVHNNGMSGEYHFPEIMGSGGAFFDFDQDGDLDIFMCQGRRLQGTPRQQGGGRLYRNDTEPGKAMRFVDITETSGIRALGFGMGAASGDIDNDGWPDLYLLNYGSNQLWRNLGDGRFEDITARSGSDDTRWSVSASFLDYDRDGWLDLFVVNYVDYTVRTNKDCLLRGRDYCNPQSYNPVPDRLFRNLGHGRFEDVSAVAQIATAFGNGLGVVSADFDGDGWQDIYVANDGTPNQLWHNLGNGRFEETGLIGGAALNLKGIPEASMGVAVGDYDGDGHQDLFMTHLRSETNTLFQNLSKEGTTRFRDQTIRAKLATPSRSLTGFGTGWIDMDNDGWLDLLVANGSVAALEDQIALGNPFPYAQPDQFFRNMGNGQFEDQSGQAGLAVTSLSIGRGAIFGDLDNDGDTDLVINNNHAAASLLRNDLGSKSNWIGIRLLGTEAGRDMLGSRLTLHTKEGRQLVRHLQTDGSYAAANDPRVLIGLGQDRALRLDVIWPDGKPQSFAISANRTWLTFNQASTAER